MSSTESHDPEVRYGAADEHQRTTPILDRCNATRCLLSRDSLLDISKHHPISTLSRTTG